MKLLLLLLSLPALFSRVEPAVPALTDLEGNVVCSATSVELPDGDLLTAKHCIGAETLNVNGRAVTVVRAANVDLVVLRFADGKPSRLPKLKMRQKPLARGSFIAVFGYPLGEIFAGWSGTLGSYVASDGMVWIDVHVVPGQSGGPVVDEQGRVVTIVKGIVRGLLVAESPEAVQRFVAGK